MRIIAYTYDADVHCVACTSQAWLLGAIDLKRGLHHLPTTATLETFSKDEHGLPIRMVDSEGNDVRPVFSTDEHDFTHCGTCRRELE